MEKFRSALMVMATGLGKTQTFLWLAEEWIRRHSTKVLILAHREELIFQPAKRWKEISGYAPAIEMGEFKIGECENQLVEGIVDSRIIIATVQTMTSGRRCLECTATCDECESGKIAKPCPCECSGQCSLCRGSGEVYERCEKCEGDGWCRVNPDCDKCYRCFKRRMLKIKPNEIGLIISDEAHHAVSPMWREVVSYFFQNPQCRLIGPTATPDRSDETALGSVFDTVAFEYNLPEAVQDGWLVKPMQRYIVVEGLDFSQVRKTAGDLNEGDLDRIIREEEMLHKIVKPTLDEAGDRPTLWFMPGVESARAAADIINRYDPGSAVCITGKTPKDLRRTEIESYQRGRRRHLVGCGVFLEGFDAPATAVIAMARPTSSRSLYAQAVGRGTRPLPGIVDTLATPEERRAAIARSGKPNLLVLDFVGNSGQHKLVSTVDLLGGNYTDELREKAVRQVRNSGKTADMQAILEKLELQRQKRENAKKRQEKEDELRRQTAKERGGVVAAAALYSVSAIDPFNVLDLAPQREPGHFNEKGATETQLQILRRCKVDIPESCTRWVASQLIEEVFRRRKAGLCTYAQAKILRKNGYSGDVPFKDASRIIDGIFKRRR